MLTARDVVFCCGLLLLLSHGGCGLRLVSLRLSRPTRLSAAANDDDSRKKIAGAAAGALAGGLVAGPVGAVLGFAVGDMMSNKPKQQQAQDPAVAEAQKLASALEDAKSVRQSLEAVIEQRVKDTTDLKKRQEELQNQAREFLLSNNEAAARKCLEQKLDITKAATKLEAGIVEDRARLQGVEGSISKLQGRIAEYESMFLDRKISNIAETTSSAAPLDPLEERFRKLERE